MSSCQTSESAATWIGQGVVTAAVYGAAATTANGLRKLWSNYRDLLRDAPRFYEQLARIDLVLANMNYIITHDEFQAALEQSEHSELTKALEKLEKESQDFAKSIMPFRKMEDIEG